MKTALLFAAMTLALPAIAQPAFPTRVVTIVVPYSAGGGTDGTARAVANGLSRLWGQPVVVENIGGADGLIGTRKVARAAADGYTVVLSVPNLLLFKHSKAEGNFNALAALQPLSLVAKYPVVVIASNASGIKTMADVKTVCAKGACSWGSGEQYSWLAGQSLLDAIGVQATSVPYRGNNPVTNDVLGGHLQLGVGALASSLAHSKSGTLKVVAGLGAKRPESMPELPTLAEAGFGNLPIGEPWYGLFAPKGTPAAVMAVWQKGLQAVQKDPDVLKALAVVSADPVFSDPAEFALKLAGDEKAFDALIARHPLPQ